MARIVPKEELEARRPQPTPAAPPQLDIQALVSAMARAISEIKLPAPQVTVTAGDSPITVERVESPSSWRFVVKRDKDGYISEINATVQG